MPQEKNSPQSHSSRATTSKTDFEMALSSLAQGKNLNREEAAGAMKNLLEDKQEEIADSQIAAFIMGLGTKGETLEEVMGLLEAIMAVGDKVPVENPEEVLDTCGTGGDGQNTFNVSTIAGLIAASGGARVVKHGNTAVSSGCGSANLLNILGVNIHLSPKGVASCLETVGFGFCFAKHFHSAFGRVAKVRKELGIRTVFNILGPLSNPANAGRQVLGVANPDMCELAADILLERGSTRALIVCGLSPKDNLDEGNLEEGYFEGAYLDEVSIFGKTQIIEIENGEKKKYEITPEEFGIERRSNLDEIQVELPVSAALAAKEIIIERKSGAMLDMATLNAGAALFVADKAKTIKEGYEKARELLLNESAAALLSTLVKASNSLESHKKAPKLPEIETKELVSALKFTFKVSKSLAKHDIPVELNRILNASTELQKSDYEKMRSLIDSNPQFRANLLSSGRGARDAADPSNYIAFVWLVREVGWEDEVRRVQAEAELEKGRNQDTDKLKSESQRLTKGNQKLEKKNKKLEEKSKKAEDDKRKLTGKISRLQKDLKNQEDELNKVQENLDETTRQLGHEEYEHSYLKKELREAKSEIEKLRKSRKKEKELLKDAISRIKDEEEKNRLKQEAKAFRQAEEKSILIEKPISLPGGVKAGSDEAAAILMGVSEAWLLVDGHNVIYGKREPKTMNERKEQAMRREELIIDIQNITKSYPINHAVVFFDSKLPESERGYSGNVGKTSHSHDVLVGYALQHQEADDAIVEFAKSHPNPPLIVLTKDGGLKKRLEEYKVNHLTHNQFNLLAKKGK